MTTARIICGDVREVLPSLLEASVQCVVTSPPYWGLRDYGIPPSVWGGGSDCAHEWGADLRLHNGGPHGDGVMLAGGRSVVAAQAAVKDRPAGAFCSACGAWRGCLGLEPTYQLYVEHMVSVFAEVRRVLRPDGVLWLNLGDCYATGAGAVGDCPGGGEQGARWAGSVSETRGPRQPAVNGRGEPQQERTRALRDGTHAGKHTAIAAMGPMSQPNRMPQPGLKPKDLVGIPWRVAFALQDDGWWLRSDCIWAKPNPMPESVEDRPTKAHEYLFLLTKSERYFYDKAAILEAFADERMGRDGSKLARERDRGGRGDGFTKPNGIDPSGNGGRNKRSVWTMEDQVPALFRFLAESHPEALEAWCAAHVSPDVWPLSTQPYSGAHFAVMPEDLAEPCVLAGSREGDTVFDPFAGSGTVGVVALKNGRCFAGCELNPTYAEMARERIHDVAPLFNSVTVESPRAGAVPPTPRASPPGGEEEPRCA